MKKSYVVETGQKISHAAAMPLSAGISVKIGSEFFTFQILDSTHGRQTVLYNNRVIRLDELRGDIHVYSLREHRFKSIAELQAGSLEGEIIRAPMPGKVVKLLHAVGDVVRAGEGIFVMEAMKMQNELKTKRAGKIAEILVKEGQAVENKDVLAKIV